MGALALAAALGLFGGVLAGLFGVGGGILFVPTLTLVLGLTQIHAEASSLLAILPAVIAGAWRQHRYGNVDWRAALIVGLGSIAGVEGGVGTGIVPSSDQVFMESVVEERPEVLSGPQLQYPDLLRQAGVQGRVLVQAIIDTSGRAEPPSVKIIQSPNPGFDQPAKNYVLRALFRPARVHGRAVRVLVNLPIDFKIKR